MLEIKVVDDLTNNRQLVSGRDLHEFLEVDSNYTTWFKRMTDYGFNEDIDFIPFLEESTGGRPSQDHQLTIEMAKEISMLQRTEKGKQARQYFIQLEKAWNSPEMIMKRAMEIANKRVEEMQERMKLNEPLINFGRAVLNSDDAIAVGTFCKLLYDKENYSIGRNKLFEWLRANGYLIKHGREYNLPYQRYVEQGLFEVKESVQHTPKGDKLMTTVLITGKGQVYFTKKLINKLN